MKGNEFAIKSAMYQRLSRIVDEITSEIESNNESISEKIAAFSEEQPGEDIETFTGYSWAQECYNTYVTNNAALNRILVLLNKSF